MLSENPENSYYRNVRHPNTDKKLLSCEIHFVDNSLILLNKNNSYQYFITLIINLISLKMMSLSISTLSTLILYWNTYGRHFMRLMNSCR